MSRRRKRRGRSIPQEPQTAPEDNAGSELEIVDDVGMLEEAAHSAAGSRPVTTSSSGEGAPADAAASRSEGVEENGSGSPSSRGDASGAPTEGAAVHVVDSLHEFPKQAEKGERNVETLGELLQHAREARGLSLEETSARTRIALPTLRHLENDRFGEIPAEAYVKGFLRSYGSFLNLDVAMLLRRYEKLSGHVSTPVAEIWDEVEVKSSRLRLWTPSRRTVAIGGAVLIVAALAWVFWSQGAVMLGLRPEGELQQIEMQLQRESETGGTPQAPITGLDDAALQESAPPVTEVPANHAPAEDTAPTVPLPVQKPAADEATRPATTGDTSGSGSTAGPASPSDDSTESKPAVTKPKPEPAKRPSPKPVEKPKKKAPAPSPEDAAGPPG